MSQPVEIFAKDYQPPLFAIDKTALTFELADGTTRVTSTLSMRLNGEQSGPLKLHGQHLTLISIKLDGRLIGREEFHKDEEHLTILQPPEVPFELEVVTEIHPEKNLALEGLYRSRGMYCTQCEAEGFRRITYYLDRPDVLSEFETTLIAPEGKFPVMLSNGNCIADSVENGQRKVTWHDPFKKPCYLFALVAGDLQVVEDTFITCSGKTVDLKIYVEEKDLDKCAHAMASLKASMRWDEEVYGREYDLDIFMIVAVDDFNMGAMENKGLNIFNTSCVLANPATTTDAGFQRVEAVVAHEYFHNWSGNRVTCRDWFQLSLKEGFTVYRDSEFSADMNSRAVKRIEDAGLMRTLQFAEDSGPMSHPVRPDSYMEISNFYTLTVYEKGAEVVRMMANMLGRETFRKATDLYFDRFDGMAVTCEDFVQCMEEASGLDLQQFRLWYSQAGTPEITVVEDFDEENSEYRLTITQKIPDTPGQTGKKPMHIPFDIALLSNETLLPLDNSQTHKILNLTQSSETFRFSGIKEKPTPTLLRGFSAPVKVDFSYSEEQLAQIAIHETDGYSRYNALQQLFICQMHQVMSGNNIDTTVLIPCVRALLEKAGFDPAMLAKLLVLPSESYLIEMTEAADPLQIFHARKQVQQLLADQLSDEFSAVYEQMARVDQGMSGEAMAARSLKNCALYYLVRQGEGHLAKAQQQLTDAVNMTDEAAALQTIVHLANDKAVVQHALDAFYERWQHEGLVVNMWLQIQASVPSDTVLEQVGSLMTHPAYEASNPNKIRSLFGAFAANVPAFHQVSGKGYAFLADQVLAIDAMNPQIASRLVTPLTRYGKLAKSHADRMLSELERIHSADLSKDLAEVIQKSLV